LTGSVVADLSGLPVSLSPAHAAGLALALLRAAREGGADVTEHIRDAAEELTDATALAATIVADLAEIEAIELAEREDEYARAEADEDASPSKVISWQEYLTKVGGQS
jgi:sugar (pentulose or hexulose) kinase